MRGQRGIYRHAVVGRARQFILGSSQKCAFVSHRSKANTDNNARIRLVRVLHRGVYNPDLWLPGSLRDRLEPDQKHIIQVHEPLADFPMLGGGFAYGIRFLLWFGRE